MNLAEALNAALPELPAGKTHAGYPKLDPGLIANENIEDGQPVIVALIRGQSQVFRIPPEQWRVIELFDGTRSWDDVADLHAELHGTRYSAEDIRELTSQLDALDFWYKTPLEKNIALLEKLEAGRHQHAHRKSKWGDIAHLQFSAWDPENFFDTIYPYLKWIYSRWFALLTAALFVFMMWVFVANWSQIGQDTLAFYNFSQKSAGDLAEFWVLFLILAFFHESAHGLTCKHYGGQIHRMGFHLIYLTPAFFVDVSEVLVYANRWQRLITILAGIGIELIFCAFATVVWWGTPSGSGVHDLAYKIMLITGVAVVVVNMNPLIKLDGYYAFSEIIGFADIKEKSTAWLSQIVRRKIFRLPVEIDYVPRRRRPGFLFYAVTSGLYSYLLLLTVIRFCDHVFARYSPQWAFVPALALAFVIFRSRIRNLVRLMQTIYLDKQDRVRAWFTAPRLAVAGVALLVLLFAPLWHQTVDARFLLEPSRSATVRATVPGRVLEVLVDEGQSVQAGTPLLRMENANLESARATSGQDFALTGLERVQAQLAHRNLGTALEQHQRAGAVEAIADEENAALTPAAPIDGVVTTPQVRDLAGSYLDAGSVIAQVADTRTMRVRIFVPEFAVGWVHAGETAHLLLDGNFRRYDAPVVKLEPAPGELPPAVEPSQQIKGATQLMYYTANVLLPNDGSLREGMTGTAKILVRRTNLAAMTLRAVREFAERKIW